MELNSTKVIMLRIIIGRFVSNLSGNIKRCDLLFTFINLPSYVICYQKIVPAIWHIGSFNENGFQEYFTCLERTDYT